MTRRRELWLPAKPMGTPLMRRQTADPSEISFSSVSEKYKKITHPLLCRAFISSRSNFCVCTRLRHCLSKKMQHRVTGKAAPQPLPARLCNEEQRKKQQEGVRKRKDQREPTRRESALAVAAGAWPLQCLPPFAAQDRQHFAYAGTVAVYASIQLTIRLFHHMRRKFLRRLLLDLCWALNELAAEGAVQQHWLDFGALLGIYRDGDVGAVCWIHAHLPPAIPILFCLPLPPMQLIEHDSDIDVSVLEVADWHKLLIGLQSRLPQYSMRVVIPSDDPNARFIRVYCHLGMADVFGATPCGDDRLLVDWWVKAAGLWLAGCACG